MRARGIDAVRVETVLSPPWSTRAISADGRAKLAAYGIAPPDDAVSCAGGLAALKSAHVACPRCQSPATEVVQPVWLHPARRPFGAPLAANPSTISKPFEGAATMAEFHPLTVTDLARDTADAVVVTLRPPAELADRFAYRPGQYLTFKRDFDGVELRRSYSICASQQTTACASPLSGCQAAASTWANEGLKVGDRLAAMPPAGCFTVTPEPAAAKTYLGLAAGSGITPVLGIMKTLLEEEPQSRFHLIYGNRSVNSILFRDEIDDLKNLHMTRLAVTHVLSQGGDLAALSGRLDAAKCAHFFNHSVDPASLDRAFLCGPEGFIDTPRRPHSTRSGTASDRLRVVFRRRADRQPGGAPGGRRRRVPGGSSGGAQRRASDHRHRRRHLGAGGGPRGRARRTPIPAKPASAPPAAPKSPAVPIPSRPTTP